MGDGQRVDPSALYRQAAEMLAQRWHNPNAEAVMPPDAIPSSSAAVANLNDNAKALLEFQQWAETENRRIAEMLQIAADAYTHVDETYGRVITDPERRAALDAIPIPAPATSPPAAPTPAGAPRPLDASGYSDVRKTQAELSSPDEGNSLKTAMLQWGAAAKHVEAMSPRPPSGDWEGAAADAAYARMTEFSGHLRQLSEGWRDLAEAAAKVLAAHGDAKARHADIHREYVELETQLRELAAQMTAGNTIATEAEIAKIQKRMRELQQQSDEVRRDYANDATFAPVRPAMPTGSDSDVAATAGVGGGSGGGSGIGSGGGGGGGAGGRYSTGDPAALADEMAQSLGGQARQDAGGAPPGGGAPLSGGAPSGGSGAGGGTPGGGSPAAKPRADPGLRPAAVSRGGGSGGGAGGGGGGMPATPMSAPVTAETVAPAPTTPAAAGAGAGPAAEGRAAGGMGGGMAPMGHGAGALQGKEKRRDPRLAPDEDLYAEDRPWTEAVIGNRRRREVGDGREGRDAK